MEQMSIGYERCSCAACSTRDTSAAAKWHRVWNAAKEANGCTTHYSGPILVGALLLYGKPGHAAMRSLRLNLLNSRLGLESAA